MASRYGDWTNSVCAYYDSVNNLLFLRSDDASSWLGGFAPGSAHVISNAQGSLDCSTTTVTRSGTDLLVNWKITPLDGLVGSNIVFAYAADQGGLNSGLPFGSLGTWQVSNAGHTPTLSAAPVAFDGGPNSAHQIAVTYHDEDGASDISSTWLVINREQTWRLGLTVMFDVRDNLLYVRDDDAQNWLGGFAPGSAHTISNSLGSLDCAATTVTRSGNDLTVSYAVTALSALDGHNGVWSYCEDRGGLNSGQPFTSIGSWDVSGQAPIILMPSPLIALHSAVGQERGIVVSMRDPDGAASQINAQVIINDRLTGEDSIYVYYLALSNQIFLRSDDGTTWLGGGQLGSAGVLSNAQGSLDCARSTATRSGTDLTLDLKITPKTGLVGANSIYVYAQDRAGNATSYTPVGSWQVAASALSLSGVAGNGHNTLFWAPVTEATGYMVMRSLTAGKNYTPLTTTALGAGVTTYTDSGLTNGTPLYYMVYPTLADGRGPDSNEVALTPASSIDARINTGTGTPWVGDGVVSATAQGEEVSQQAQSGGAATYFVSVRRTAGGSNESVRLSVPGFAAFEEAGGSASFVVPTTNQDITDTITSAGGWATNIAPGQEALVRVEMTVPAGAAVGSAQSLLVLATDEDGSQAPSVDAVKAALIVTTPPPQDTQPWLDHIEWSVDGVNWGRDPALLALLHNQSIGLRAVAHDPIHHPWEESLNFVPTWSLVEAGQSQPSSQIGEMIWVQGAHLGTVSFAASCGRTLEGSLTVLPDPDDDPEATP